MPVPRPLALMMLFALCAGLAAAQSQESHASDLVVFRGSAAMNFSDSVPLDQLHVTQNLPSGFHLQSSETSIPARATDSSPFFSSRSTSGMSLGPESDETCYYIRGYVVIRDSPHSDSVHRDGSSTCVPAARFRVYTTGR